MDHLALLPHKVEKRSYTSVTFDSSVRRISMSTIEPNLLHLYEQAQWLFLHGHNLHQVNMKTLHHMSINGIRMVVDGSY